eukprot:gene12123-biopygen5671
MTTSWRCEAREYPRNSCAAAALAGDHGAVSDGCAGWAGPTAVTDDYDACGGPLAVRFDARVGTGLSSQGCKKILFR